MPPPRIPITEDRTIDVRTNIFRIKQLPLIQYYQYDAIKPDLKIVRRRRELVEKMQVSYPNIFQPRCIHDGKAILYSPRRLGLQGGSSGTLEVSVGDGPRDKYQVKLTFADRVINFGALKNFVDGHGSITPEIKVAVNLLQMVLRQAASMQFASKGRTIFTDQARPLDLGQGVNLLSGFFQSVRPIDRWVTVNVDLSNAAFYKDGPLSSLALNVLHGHLSPDNNPRVLSTTLREKNGSAIISTLKQHFYRVLIKVPRVSKDRIRTIRGIKENAGNFQFTMNARDGQGMDTEMTVAQYYRDVYNIQIRNPDHFGVIVSPPDQPLQVVPFELCEVLPGQPFKRKLDDSQTRKMVDQAGKSPVERLKRIRAAVEPGGSLQYFSSNFIDTAGLQLEHEPMRIQGTLLAPHVIEYGNRLKMHPDKGAWNMLGKKVFHAAKQDEPWVVLNFTKLTSDRVKTFVRALRGCCTTLGMVIPPEDGNIYIDVNTQTTLERAIQTRSRPKFILAILKQSDADNKAKLKRYGDLEHGIITQCVREDKFASNLTPANERRLNQYCNNVALKINARVGGVNYTTLLPGLRETKHIIFGLDVSHPPGGPRLDRPSVASLVFTVDRECCKYQARYSVLRPRTEALGEDLKVMVKSAIITWMKMHAAKAGPPNSIICYRDGVSEDEYESTATSEIEVMKHAIKEGLAECAKQWRQPLPPMPKLTFIVVTKRHHFTPFADHPGDTNGREGKMGNLLAGFVTNKSTSTPGLSEFYLLSHTGGLGTSRPAHYIVLKDENFNNNILTIKRLSFALCHVYAKATRSVSIPAPVYYADLACMHAATYYFDSSLRFDGDDASTSDGTKRTNRQLREEFDLAKWKGGFGTPAPRIEGNMPFL